MSKFTEYLSMLVKRSGESISSISRNSGVERTSIHKALTGERTLPYNAARKLANYLALSPQEQRIYMEYHSMQLQGEDVFESRTKVMHLLSLLSSLNLRQEENLIPWPIEKQDLPPVEEKEFCSGEFAVRSMIRKSVERELSEPRPQIRVVAPTVQGYFYNFLHTIYERYSCSPEICHIIPVELSVNGQNKTSGMKVLENALPLSLDARGSYQPWFYYNRSDYYADPMPFFLLTSTQLICLDRYFENGMVTTDQAIYRFYYNYFQNMLQYCSILLKYESNYQLMQEYQAEIQGGSTFYELTPMPLLLLYYSEEQLTGQIERIRSEKDMGYYQGMLEMSRRMLGHYHCFFTKNGLETFARTGYSEEMPKEEQTPFLPEERKRILAEFAKDIREDRISGRLINEFRLVIPRYLKIFISRNRMDLFPMPANRDRSAHTIQLPGSHVSGMIVDFAEYLPKSEYILGKDETLEFLEQLIASL